MTDLTCPGLLVYWRNQSQISPHRDWHLEVVKGQWAIHEEAGILWEPRRAFIEK